MPFEPWMLADINHAGYNGITDAHINAVAREIVEMGIVQVSKLDFEYACRRCGIDPDSFTQDDLERLEDRLNGFSQI